MDFLFLAEIDFNAPTALGVPLGTLVLFWFIWTALKQQGESGGGSFTSPNTMDVNLRNNLEADVILFQHSEAQVGNGQCVIRYTVKLKKDGTYVIAGGKVESRSFNSAYCGTRTIQGDAGDVISGAVSCPAFYDGNWAISAFRSRSDVPKS